MNYEDENFMNEKALECATRIKSNITANQTMLIAKCLLRCVDMLLEDKKRQLKNKE